MTELLVMPGQPITSTNQSGPRPLALAGTFMRNDQLFSSRVGKVKQDGNAISVIAHGVAGQQTVIPDTGSIVIGTVTRIQRPQATLAIQTVDGQVVHNFQGVVRSQDVRQTQKDSVKIWACFRPGDIVKAKVISAGDIRSYYLTTAENSLGVVYGTSADGNQLKPVSWEMMLDPKTGKEEPRKVAAPDTSK